MIFPAIWRILPGPAWLRAVLVVVLLFAIVAVLFLVVFPWVDERLQIDEGTVQTSTHAIRGFQVLS